MGGCLSKKSTCSSCPASAPPKPSHQVNSSKTHVERKKLDEEPVKKEIFIIKHRKSHDVERKSEKDAGDAKKAPEKSESGKTGSDNNGGLNRGIFVAAPVRTSSCTKEEVDAILIQCGRLSRSSSTGKANFSGSVGSGDNNASTQKGRKYAGSKRSYDFDSENGNEERDVEKKKGINGGNEGNNGNGIVDIEIGLVGESSHRHRQRQRPSSRTVGSPSKGRRRTPSREREQGQPARSGSRERVTSSGSGRRVSRSPGRRSESPSGISAAGNISSGNGNNAGARPGKMVSVPATVSYLAMDKSNNAGGSESISASAVKRIQVKRNVGAASPRARSPARTNSPGRTNIKVLNENQQQRPGSLSRSNSRKAEISPFRRNPLSEIDTNVAREQITGTKASNNIVHQAPIQKQNDLSDNTKVFVQGTENQIRGNKVNTVSSNNLGVNVVVPSGTDCLKPQPVARSRSSRLSRDFDINPETLSSSLPSYTALLLEDIQNFHQKSAAPAVTFPPCLSKACSILEAVADLNSSSGSNLSTIYSEDKRRIPTAEFNKYCENTSFGNRPNGKKGLDTKDPFVQSEVVASDDLMEPTFQKYVTMRRGAAGVDELEVQESSGSNGFAGGHQPWLSQSSWEPNSAESIDSWASSRNTREEKLSQLELDRLAISESALDAEEAGRRLNSDKRDSEQQCNGIGRGRIGSRGFHSVTSVAAAAST